MNLYCPGCGRNLPTDDINVARDVALCRPCGCVSSFADLQGKGAAVDPANPPRRAWFIPTAYGFEVGASNRSPSAFFYLAFLFLSCGVALGGFHTMTESRFKFGPSLIALSLALGTLYSATIALMAVCGRVVISVFGDEGKIYEGVGSIGLTRRFAWSSVKVVSEVPSLELRKGETPALALEGADRLVFGTGLNESRRYFVREVLRQKIRERDAGGKPEALDDWSF